MPCPQTDPTCVGTEVLETNTAYWSSWSPYSGEYIFRNIIAQFTPDSGSSFRRILPE